MQRREHMLVSALGGYTLVVFFWLVLVGRMVDLTRLFSMIVRTFTWLALAQPDVCVRLNLFNQCWNLNIGQKVFFGSLSFSSLLMRPSLNQAWTLRGQQPGLT